MNYTRKMKTKILDLTLKGYSDKEIAKKAKVSESALKYSRTNRTLPKRKLVLNYIVSHTLYNIGIKACGEDREYLSGDFLVQTLNQLRVLTPTRKKWTMDGLKRYLIKSGVEVVRNVIESSQLTEIALPVLSDFCNYDESLDPQSYIPSLNACALTGQVDLPVTATLSKKNKRIKEAIKDALEQGAETIAEITDYLNEQGYRNKAGNPYGRWSVKLLVQKLEIEVVSKVEATEYVDLMRDWVRTHPIDEEITQENFIAYLDTHLCKGEKFKNVTSLYSMVSSEIGEHNRSLRKRQRIESYRADVEFAVYVKYKHRPITAAEIGEELGLSTMQGNRIMRESLGIDPFEVWYDNLYELVKKFLVGKTQFTIKELGEYLENSYLQTQRGNSWDYVNTNLTYKKLRERHPNLPKSLGSK